MTLASTTPSASTPQTVMHERDSALRLSPHVLAAGLALALVGLLLAWGSAVVQQMERNYIHALAPSSFDQKTIGLDLQRTAFAHPDLLPLYGASEIMELGTPYHASRLFQAYPTGFTIFPVGRPGTPLLITLQEVAALGPSLRGKQVVIMVTPGVFFDGVNGSADAYAGTFSRLHAASLLFNTDLRLDLKRAIAKRMLVYPQTLKDDALLQFAVQRLADDTPWSTLLYSLALPLGRLQLAVMELQDRWEVFNLFLQEYSNLQAELPRKPGSYAWQTLATNAQALYAQRVTNNAFGFEDSYWTQNAALLTGERGQNSDRAFQNAMANDPDWGDLELLLHVLSDLNAQPLLVALPINGTYYEYWGVSAPARQAFYKRIEATARRNDVSVVDFSDHDTDKFFLRDKWSHPSDKGWVYISQALDAFWHRSPGMESNSRPK